MVTSTRGPKQNGAAVEPRPAPGEAAADAAGGAGNASTLAQVAADQIRGAILSGAVAPGSKLHIQRLSAQFGLSATPIREGLTRLTSTGLVEALGQRGFRVQPISWKDLVDIQRMRHLVETEALRLAIEKGDLGWEQNIVGALHRLKALSFGSHEALPEGEPLFDKAHRDFHTALIAACDSPRLLAAHSELHDQVYRYRIVLRLVPRRKSVTDRDHAALARHALARDVEAAVGALHRHIDLTTQFLQQLPEEAMAAAFMQRSLSVASAAD